MPRVYIRFSGFLIHDPRVTVNDTLMLTLVNNVTGTAKTRKFTFQEASSLKKSYHIDIDSFNTHTFSVLLYKQTGLFGKQQLGRLDVPTFMLPMDCMSVNMLSINTGNVNNPPILCNCVIHLVDKTQPYRGKLIKPVLQQAECDEMTTTINTRVDYNNSDAPLLL